MNYFISMVVHSAVKAALLFALLSSGNWLQTVSCWSQPQGASRETIPGLSVTDSMLSPPSPRRAVLSTLTWGLMLGGSSLVINPSQVQATDSDGQDGSPFVYTRKQTVLNSKELKYEINIPSSMKEGSKPVKTHLDEVNFVSDAVKRYQYGITVDPVRISSLKEFGTPEEVAARVVTAEVNRDGIFEVTLLEDPYPTKSEDGVDAYILKYLSDGKRGKKVYMNKIVVSPNNLLYVLTAQCKEEDFAAQEGEMKSTVDSFRTF